MLETGMRAPNFTLNSKNDTPVSLSDFLGKKTFADVPTTVLSPCEEDVRGFNAYTERFKKLLTVEKAAELTFNTSKTEN